MVEREEVVAMKSRRFQGSRDPNVIILEDMFPHIDIKLSTALKDSDEILRSSFIEFVFEGPEEDLRFIEDNSHLLERTGWRLGDPLSTGDSELRVFKQPRGDLRDHIEIPVFRSWHDLSEHFILANRVRLTVRKKSISILEMICDLLENNNKRNTARIGVERVIFPDNYQNLN